jgi:ubiquinone/menaquinone biosynthesis C-methylase UbiE
MERAAAGGDAVDRFYSRWAGLYDLLASRAPGIAAVRARSVGALGLEPDDVVVEMGCGTGANLPHLRESVGPGGRVVGIDLAGGALDRARKRTARAGWTNVSLLRGDATRPPLERADAVLATFVVGMFADPAAAIDRWCDLLPPGGRIALLNATRSDHPAAAPLNLAFRGFVRVGAPGGRLARGSPARDLERKVGAARSALATRCVDLRRGSLAGGFLTLASGSVGG